MEGLTTAHSVCSWISYTAGCSLAYCWLHTVGRTNIMLFTPSLSYISLLSYNRTCGCGTSSIQGSLFCRMIYIWSDSEKNINSMRQAKGYWGQEDEWSSCHVVVQREGNLLSDSSFGATEADGCAACDQVLLKVILQPPVYLSSVL